MAKRGSAFERLVKDVLSTMDRNSVVRHGQWVQGPDGRRELDVLVEGRVEETIRRVLIECKDFNPKTTGPVGIGFIDALESKRRDLNIDVSFICSNAGFTADAIRKAKRVGIGLIGVMRAADRRLRYQVIEEIYTRRIRLETINIRLRGEPLVSLDIVPAEAITFQGAPAEFGSPAGPINVTGLDIRFRISDGWFTQHATLDATSAIYDWIRRRLLPTPGPGHFEWKGVDIYTGDPIDCPPQSALSTDMQRGEMWMSLVLTEGLDLREPIPAMDDLFPSEDLDVKIPDLPPEAYKSSRA